MFMVENKRDEDFINLYDKTIMNFLNII